MPSSDLNMHEDNLLASIISNDDVMKRVESAHWKAFGENQKQWNGDLHIVLKSLIGLDQPKSVICMIEIDSYGHFIEKIETRAVRSISNATWNDEFVIELECSKYIRVILYEELKCNKKVIIGKTILKLSRSWLNSNYSKQKVSLKHLKFSFEAKFLDNNERLRRIPPTSSTNNLFRRSVEDTTRMEKCSVPFIITSLVREVDRRGLIEVGIYRVNGSSKEMTRIKKMFETSPWEAEQMIKECDIFSVGGILKQYLRELPECIFTSQAFCKLNEAVSILDMEERSRALLRAFRQMPKNPNQNCVMFLLEHLVRISQMEHQNKMGIHNLATVFGPTMLYPGSLLLEKEETTDVIKQSQILHFFLEKCARLEEIQIQQ